MVLQRLHRINALAVAQGEHRRLLSGEQVLDKHRVARVAEELLGHHFLERPDGLIRLGAYDHAFALCEPSRLDGYAVFARQHVILGLCEVGEDTRLGRRHGGGPHELLGVGFVRLDAGAGGDGTEAQNARVPHRVAQAGR